VFLKKPVTGSVIAWLASPGSTFNLLLLSRRQKPENLTRSCDNIAAYHPDFSTGKIVLQRLSG
jgi:hypothetical protein